MAPTVSDVEKIDATDWSALDPDKKQEMLDIAIREADSLYGGRVATLQIIEGNKDDFIKYLTAHKWEMAEGGEPQSESSTGGSTSYNTVTGEILNHLSETRFGRQALEYVRDESGIGFVTT